MTVVLPVPVANLSANRGSGRSGLALLLALSMMIEKVPTGSRVRRNFGEPNSSLHRFDLAEERPNATKAVVPPVLEQTCCLRGHLPLARVRQIAPTVNLLANSVDRLHQFVLLIICLKLSRSLVEHQGGLIRR